MLSARRDLLAGGARLAGVALAAGGGHALACPRGSGRDQCTALAATSVPADKPIVAPLAVGARYKLVFDDDFDDTRLARINEDAVAPDSRGVAWRSRYRHPRKDVINREKQIYMDPAFAGTGPAALGVQPFSIGDGILTIRAERADAARVAPHIWGHRYTSGCITTELTHWQTYGYFEMRARMPVGRGYWPSFWLLPKRDAWPPEIDIFEGAGSRRNKMHFGAIETKEKTPSNLSGWIDLPGGGRIDDFHVYSLEWTADRITWFVDTTRMFELRNHKIHEDMYLLANLALGSLDASWIPDPDESTPFPGRFEIDYIRAWRR